MSIFLFTVLFLLAPSINRKCNHNEEVAVMTQCIDDVMTAIYHWIPNDCENANHFPIYNISCLAICPPGKFIGINESDLVDCIYCPENTYSTGDSLRFSDRDHNFDQIYEHLETHCKWYNKSGKLQKDVGCTSWHSSANNTLLQVGEYNGSNEITYELYLHPNLIRNGSFNFQYQTNFPKPQGDSECDFLLGIDESVTLFDGAIQDKKWHYKSFPLSEGHHEIYLGLILHNFINKTSELIKINYIEIVGINNPSYSCISCKTGYCTSGSSYCTRCSKNQYLETYNDSLCYNCPFNTYAPPGSISPSSCLSKPICTIYDYDLQYGKCIGGNRSVVLSSLPYSHFCTEVPFEDIDTYTCGSCNPGFTKENYECIPCQRGYYSDGETSCQKCPANTYSESVIDLKYMDEMPNFIKTFCANQDPNVDACLYFNGWKLINNSLITTPNLIEGASLNLEFNVSIDSDYGEFEFVYETNCTNLSLFLMLINQKEYVLNLHHMSLSYNRLDKGNQKIVLSFFTFEKRANCIMKVYNIKINGENNGLGGQCHSCKDGYYSDAGSSSCISCGEGRARLNGTTCTQCKQNYFRNSRMDECEPCPLHTISNFDRSACILYDLYNLNDNYMWNAFKFDTEQDFSSYGNSKKFVSEGFFGPIFMDDQESILYFSPKIPKKFVSEYYEYEDEDNTKDKNSYIFGLFHITQNEFNLISTDDDAIVNPRHERILKSIGSEIVNVDFNNFNNSFNFNSSNTSLATIKYINGDNCIEDPNIKYSTNITFVCDKSKNHFKPKLQKYDKCHFDIEWASPYACSECLFEDTLKYQTSCVDKTRNTYMEEGPNCILLFQLNGDFTLEKTTFQNKNYNDNNNNNNSNTSNEPTDSCSVLISNSKIKFSSLILNISEEIVKSERVQFSYYDTMVGDCNDLEISYIIVLIFLIAGMVVLIIALICGFRARKFRVEYIALKEDVDKGINTGRGNPLESSPNDAPLSNKD